MTCAEPAVRDAPHELLGIEDVVRRPVRLAVSVFPAILSAIDAVGGRDRTIEPEVMRAVVAALTPEDAVVLRPLILRPRRFLPDCLIPVPDGTPARPADELESIAQASPDRLLAELEVLDDLGPWAPVARRPRQWLAGYHRALRHCWRALEPYWTRATPAWQQETDRVGAALARGVVGDLLLAAQPPGAVHDGMIAFPAAPRRVPVSERGLILMPKIIGSPALALRIYESGALTHLAYRMPGAPLANGRGAEGGGLAELLGIQRALILRDLDHPRTVGWLADRLIAVPSAATHHVSALERAGLVRRIRRGRYVDVERTPRGTALLALYER